MENKNKIKYIAYYAIENDDNRLGSLAAKVKIDYVIKHLNKLNIDVDLISPSWTQNKTGIYKGRKTILNKNTNLITFPTFGTKTKLFNLIKYKLSIILLCFYLIFNTKKRDKIIIYHSVSLYWALLVLKYIKKTEVILEVEEIYSDIQNMSKLERKREFKIFDLADKFILSTETLNNKVNLNSKPYVIFHGPYEFKTSRNNNRKFNKTINIVYAGTFDPKKGGADAAIESIRFLDENYHLHILGFGSPNEVTIIKNKIKEISMLSKARITYVGLLKGDKFDEYLQSCDIGLSTQEPLGEYNDSSFPSKILTYLGNGLRVITVQIDSVYKSKLKPYLFFISNNSPKDISNAIKSINFNDEYNSEQLLNKLDNEFINDLYEIINDNR